MSYMDQSKAVKDMQGVKFPIFSYFLGKFLFFLFLREISIFSYFSANLGSQNVFFSTLS